MTIAAPQKHRWDTGAYLTIRSARCRDGSLVVRFADGDEVSVPVDRFAARMFVEPDWSAVSGGPLWVTVPTANGDVEISWLSIRLMTDPEFRAHWENHALAETEIVGARTRRS